MHDDLDLHLEHSMGSIVMLQSGEEPAGLSMWQLHGRLLCSDHTLSRYDAPIPTFCVILRRCYLFCVCSPTWDVSVCCCCPSPCPKIWEPGNLESGQMLTQPDIHTWTLFRKNRATPRNQSCVRKELASSELPKVFSPPVLEGGGFLELHGRLACERGPASGPACVP